MLGPIAQRGLFPMLGYVTSSLILGFSHSTTILTLAVTVTGRFGGHPFRRQFFAESSMKFWTFRGNFLPVLAKYDGRCGEIIIDE